MYLLLLLLLLLLQLHWQKWIKLPDYGYGAMIIFQNAIYSIDIVPLVSLSTPLLNIIYGAGVGTIWIVVAVTVVVGTSFLISPSLLSNTKQKLDLEYSSSSQMMTAYNYHMNRLLLSVIFSISTKFMTSHLNGNV